MMSQIIGVGRCMGSSKGIVVEDKNYGSQIPLPASIRFINIIMELVTDSYVSGTERDSGYFKF